MSFGERKVIRENRVANAPEKEKRMEKGLIPQNKLDAIEKLIAEGDLAPMSPPQRLDYMRSMCKLLGISMLGQPFDFIKLNGKVQMYANAKCAAQLRARYKISIKIIQRERIDGLYCVTSQATTGKARTDESIGAINIKGLGGEALANALMKCETKSKRRVTLSLCGLGMLDSDTAKEIAEMEAKQETERAVEETTEKIAKTVSRPEFEETKAQDSSVSPEPSPTGSKEYTLRSVKGQKGKVLSKVPLNALVKWLKFYDDALAKGQQLHPDVQDDAFHIRPFLEEAATAEPLEAK